MYFRENKILSVQNQKRVVIITLYTATTDNKTVFKLLVQQSSEVIWLVLYFMRQLVVYVNSNHCREKSFYVDDIDTNTAMVTRYATRN